MHELLADPFYEAIRKYDRCVIEYCLMKDGAPYRGMQSHKEAVSFAMLRAIDRCKGVADDPRPWSCDIDKAKAVPIDAATFLHAPEMLRADRNGRASYDCGRNSYPDAAPLAVMPLISASLFSRAREAACPKRSASLPAPARGRHACEKTPPDGGAFFFLLHDLATQVLGYDSRHPAGS